MANTAKTIAFFDKLNRKLQQSVKKLPRAVGNEAVNFALDNFKDQAWNGNPWPKRKRNKDPGRALLIKSGRLRRGLRIISSSDSRVSVGVLGVPYARIHNDGGQIKQAARSETFKRPFKTLDSGMRRFVKITAKNRKSGQGFTFKERQINMPRRRFLGDSTRLRKRIYTTSRDIILKSLQ